MSSLRNQLIFYGIFGLLLLTTLVMQSSIVGAVLPLLALIAWGYVIWSLLKAHHRQGQLAVVTPAPERRSLTEPVISGTIQAPAQSRSIDPDEMARYLSSRLIGQDMVARQLARGVYRRMAQERRGKPVFTALLSGPTGTGKTEMAKAMADYLFGGGESLFRVDCANILGEAGLQTLIGSPKGFAGSSSWGSLTAHLRSSPRTVLLFDELEKAVTSPTAPMAKLLLSLLDEGTCTEQSDGSKVNATGAVILMTSNAAQEQLAAIHSRYHDQPEELLRATKDTLRDFFAPEFLARIDLVTTFSPLDADARARIIALHAARLASTYGLELVEVDANFINEALRLWTTMEGYGTREIIRWIEQQTADDLIEAKESGTNEIRLSWNQDGAKVERQ